MTRALSLAVLAFALTGCGTSSPSLGRLRRQATRICQLTLASSDRIAPPALPSDTAPFLRRGASALSIELSELRTLKAPAANEAPYSAALAAQSRQLTLLDGTIRDLDRGADPVSAIKTLQRRLAPTESAEDAAWRTLDIPACAVR
ncbi:MAG TPA: hypothetical protein VMG37_21540 [Solirubrobacteraceae bacterium]|nr:hypothetical protein [Solirubrobacteraceae bacterium]